MQYFKKPVRDYYYRSGRNHKTALSKVSTKTPEHFLSHEGMFKKIAQLLLDAGKLHDVNGLQLAAAFWWLAGRWQFYKYPRSAKRTWQTALSLGLISRSQHAQGRMILNLRRIPGCRRLKFTNWFWPPELFRTGSAYLHRTPLASLGGV
jgi:hypothetical protein